MPTYLRAVLLAFVPLTPAPAGAALCQYVGTVDQDGETELLHPCVGYSGQSICDEETAPPGEDPRVAVVICLPDPQRG